MATNNWDASKCDSDSSGLANEAAWPNVLELKR